MQGRTGTKQGYVLIGWTLVVTLFLGCGGRVRDQHTDMKAVTVPITQHDGMIFVPSTVNGKPVTLMLDTGAGGNVITPEAAQRLGLMPEKGQVDVHGSGGNAPPLQTVTGRGVGGLIYGDLVRLPEITLGSFHFQQVPATLSQQTTGVHADTSHSGNVGAEIWQRFTLTLDYAGNKMFLTPNALYDRPFIGNRSGLQLDFSKETDTILAVLPNSPASEAGIKQGETVLAIDDSPLAKINLLETHALFRRAIGTKMRLRLRSATGEERDATLTLRDVY